MHVYIYDEFVNKKKYENILARIETRITDLGLSGRIIRLGMLKDTYSMIENEMKRGAKTIIAVGNDETVARTMNIIINHEVNSANLNIPLGIIPVGEKGHSIARALGINLEEDACDVLSARRIEKMDVGVVRSENSGSQPGDKYFMANASITSLGTTLEIEKNYAIEITEPGEIKIINLSTFENLPDNIKPSPQDNILELLIQTTPRKGFFKKSNETNQSVFSLKKLTVLNENAPLILDNSIEVPAPAEITVLKQKLNVIVGKDRAF